MLKQFLTPSKCVGLIIAVLFSIQFCSILKPVVNNESKCINAYDGFGYYLYLPHLIQKGNLYITKEWAQQMQNEYCNGIFAYQISPSKNGEPLNIYHMGQAFVEAPSFFIGHVFAKTLGYKADGMTKPYNIAHILNALLFIFLGIIYFRKLCLLFFNEVITSILLTLAFLGTNYWITATLAYSLQHLYLFTFIAAFGYFFFKSVSTLEINKRSLIISALLFGLCVAIRPTHAVLGIVPFVFLLKRHGRTRQFLKLILLFPIFALIWNIPQVLYWRIVGGEWLILNMHTEDITLFDPSPLKFLFSYRKGWLLYSPLFLLLIPAFVTVYRKKREYFLPFLSLILLLIWVFSAWECWWYASSFGQRVMVDFYPLILLLIGLLLVELRTKTTKLLLGIFISSTLILNIFQSWQVVNYFLPVDRISKEYYWNAFGTTDNSKINTNLLLVDKSDTTWANRFSSKNIENFRIKESLFYSIDKPIVVPPGKSMPIAKIPYFEHFDTDETLLNVSAESSTKDSLTSALLVLNTTSKYNVYGWNSIELSLGRNKGLSTAKTTFNIPDIRHKKDYLDIYIVNNTSSSIKLTKLNINSKSLIRE